MATVNLAPTIGVAYQSFLNSGAPNTAGYIYTYLAGTTTPAATYTTSDGSVQNANPIQLDGSGRPSSEVWLDVTRGAYKLVITDSSGATIKTYDNIKGIPQSSGYAPVVSTMAALRLISYAQNTSASVLGYYAASDGGGNDYAYDSADTTSGCYFTGSVSGTGLNVSAVTNGTIHVGMMISRSDTGAAVGWVTAFGSGSGGTGTYTINNSATVASMAMMADYGGKAIVAADGARWKSKNQSQMTALMFGAIVGGSTDSYWPIYAGITATNDLLITDGTYRVDTMVAVKDDQSITLQSINTVLKRVSAASSTDPVISALGLSAKILGQEIGRAHV